MGLLQNISSVIIIGVGCYHTAKYMKGRAIEFKKTHKKTKIKRKA